MPDLDIIVSQIPSAVQDNSSDWVMLTQPNAQAETGYSTAKETLENIAKKAVHGIEYETLLANFPSGKRNPTDALNVLNDFIQSQLPVNSSSGSIATFSTSLALPLVELKAEIVAQQAGSGTPSPSTPLPISGVSAVNVTACGKNLLNNDVSAFNIVSQNYLQAKMPSVPKIISLTDNDTSVALTGVYFGAFKEYADSSEGYVWLVNNGTISRRSFDITDYDYITVYPKTALQTVFDGLFVQVETGSTATSYEPYNADTFTIALGQTVYGGSVDAKSGNAYATVKYFSFSEAQYYGTYGTDNANLYYVEIPDYDTVRVKAYTGTGSADCVLVSNIFVKNSNSSSSGMGDNQFRTQAGTAPRYFYFRADQFADLTALNAFLANTPLQVVAELQTPTSFSVTPTTITTKQGTNNIYADCGDVEVSYKQGVQEYIDAKIAETQALIL